MILSYAVPALVFLLAPVFVLWLCRRVPLLDRIGPILILYVLGAVLGNLPLLGIAFFPEGLPAVQEALSSITIPLAIPLLLSGCIFRRSDTRGQLLSMLFGMLAVIIAVVGGYLLFGARMSPDDDPLYGAKVGAMMTGTYTGGTVNMASIQKMLSVREETFILANTADMVISFLYLVFLVSVGIRLFRRILPYKGPASPAASDAPEEERRPFEGLASRKGLRSGAASLGIALLIFGISYLVATYVNSMTESDIFMVVFILLLTTAGIGVSFIQPVRTLPYSNDIGMYYIYVFSIVVASMADFSRIDLSGSLYVFLYLTFIVFGSLLLHTLFARLLRIDADTMVITSVAYINSPPFVPVIATAMKNPGMLVPGLSIGIIGYAAGNYLGLLIFQLLSAL